ncbi:MAG: Zn-ribbon domain-containing OB-fold protein [Acidimicrobiales bacterium]|nr:Zn-ribbon domain-containing OB-fold protein [Acidimicrobiales bacterium]
MSDKPFRVLPRLTDANEPFWLGGAEGELRFWRCQDCGYRLHPPGPICPRCRTKHLAVEAVSGKGTVFTYTINHQPWIPTFDPPYVVAIVELAEQDDLRLTTNIVGCDPDEVTIGMPVRVTFEHYDDNGYEVWLPLFEPDVAGGAA